MRIVIGDDHGLIRTGIKLIASELSYVSIVGEGSNGEEVCRLMQEEHEAGHKVDLVILDIQMPVMNGFVCAKQILQKYPGTKILFLSMYEETEYVLKAFQMGAVGYVSKGYADEELPQALQTIYDGGTFISPRLGHLLIRGIQMPMTDSGETLSAREMEVLSYICKGYALTEIGAMLNLSVKTIDTYKTRIFAKTGCTKKHELVAYAKEKGFVDF